MNAASASSDGLKGKVALVWLAAYPTACPSSPKMRRDTKRVSSTDWGRQVEGGLLQPYVKPYGVHPEIQLATFPDGFSAD